MKAISILVLLLTLCFSNTIQAKNNDSLILDVTKKVLTIIKNKDYKTFAEYIHPTLGVRYSPYSYIDPATDLKFTRKKFLIEINKSSKFNWGNYDGSGDKILLTIKEYFKTFIYNKDFLNTNNISINKITVGGNTVNNLTTIYKNCDFTECVFPGSEKIKGGTDWCGLRLIFKQYNHHYYLVGIVHDQWTI